MRVKAWLARKKAYQDLGQTDILGPSNIKQHQSRARKFPEILSQVEEEEVKSELEGCHQDADVNE